YREYPNGFSLAETSGMSSTPQSTVTRRLFLRATASTTAPALLVAHTPLAAAKDVENAAARRLNVVCIGGHPDDPESGCTGTLARNAETGHKVTVIYLTRGEAGIPGKAHADAAVIRSAECEAACRILGVEPVFAGQIDGASEITRPRVAELQKILSGLE